MTEPDLRKKFEELKPIYAAWGNFIKDKIVQRLEEQGFKEKEFLKIPPEPRVKETNSFIEKALYRNKPYQNPIEDITDKVGVRFVVLDLQDIKTVQSCIVLNDGWSNSKDRDFDDEIILKPELFTYKSIHYILRCKDDIIYNGIKIEAGTPCEVQVRTLLQHAYAELFHDAQYKKVEEIPPDIKRKIARSMALIEASDELFEEVKMLLDERNEVFKTFISSAQTIMPKSNYNESLNKTVFEAYRDLVDIISIEKVLEYIKEKDFLLRKMESMRDVSLLYSQPIMALIYYLIDNKQHTFLSKWPLSSEPLTSLYSDLGKSLEC